MIALAVAALVTATPATFAAKVASARAGDTIKLVAGDYGAPTIAGHRWSPPVTIDAVSARFSGLTVKAVTGLSVSGGRFSAVTSAYRFTPVITLANSNQLAFRGTRIAGPGAAAGGEASGTGVNARLVDGLSLVDVSVTGVHRGVVLYEVSHGTIADLKLFGIRSDGLDIAASHNIGVERLECSDFKPVEPDHPDCVQLWSTAGKPPTSDVIVRHSRVMGDMQGISGFNHVRNGIDDGGFDRIQITDNYIRNSYPSAVTLQDARDSLIARNDIASLSPRYWSHIGVARGTTRLEDNRIGPRPPRMDGRPSTP